MAKRFKGRPRTAQHNHLNANPFSPMTNNQAVAAKIIDAGKDVMILGSAGTGKSFLALNKAMEMLANGSAEKILIVRSTVPSRNQGFLPGTAEEKAAIYETPYQGIMTEICGRGDAYSILKQKGIIEFVSTSYLRGLTYDNTVIIIDESQNCTWEEINTVYTRIGQGSQCIICGDIAQTDKDVGKSGLARAIEVATGLNHFGIVWMTEDDIVRSERIKSWIIQSNKLS